MNEVSWNSSKVQINLNCTWVKVLVLTSTCFCLHLQRLLSKKTEIREDVCTALLPVVTVLNFHKFLKLKKDPTTNKKQSDSQIFIWNIMTALSDAFTDVCGIWFSTSVWFQIKERCFSALWPTGFSPASDMSDVSSVSDNLVVRRMVALFDYDPWESSPNVDSEVRTETPLNHMV